MTEQDEANYIVNLLEGVVSFLESQGRHDLALDIVECVWKTAKGSAL